MRDIGKEIGELVKKEKVVLFMKGTPEAPRCGFSAAVSDILNRKGVSFAPVDVLEDAEMREGVKAFSSWPTIPQLFIGGEFIGGCDIARELDAKGELAEILKKSGALA